MNQDLFAEQLRTLTDLNNARQREVEGYAKTMLQHHRLFLWLLTLLLSVNFLLIFVVSSKMEVMPRKVTDELLKLG